MRTYRRTVLGVFVVLVIASSLGAAAIARSSGSARFSTSAPDDPPGLEVGKEIQYLRTSAPYEGINTLGRLDHGQVEQIRGKWVLISGQHPHFGETVKFWINFEHVHSYVVQDKK